MNLADRHIPVSMDELNFLLSAVSAVLATMSLDVPPGQPTPPEMKMVEALQAKLMAIRG